ncbi:uncharacterized protein VNE69_06165 [Vairimorpha necatrix]|uniref:Uncharacterized protein n=1 Tax=Vairimorpha necatrix TaxID=6039 RepID=A0AAX4JDK7_9MICR
MLFVYLTYIMNMHQAIGSNETETMLRIPNKSVNEQPNNTKKPVNKKKQLNYEETNNIKFEIEDCCQLFSKNFHNFPMTIFFESESDEISRTLFNFVLDNINFPIIGNIQDTIPLGRKYTINRKDIRYNLYYNLLRNIFPDEIYRIDEREIYKFTESLAQQTRKMFATLLCINFNIRIINPNEIKLYIGKHMNIKMGTKLNYKIKKVFDSDNYHSIGANLQYFTMKHKNEINFSRFNQNKQNVYDNGKVIDYHDHTHIRLPSIE